MSILLGYILFLSVFSAFSISLYLGLKTIKLI
nr:cytochrome b6-f complex subunit VI [Rhodospora sordida]UNJ15054.1 cytochrome b6-f complex subunit VI [Rhodospora sordida]